MYTYDPAPGQHISKTAETLVALATEHGEARATFNDIELVAHRGTTAGDVVAHYHRVHEERAAAFEASQEWQERKRRAEEEQATMRQRADSLLSTLDALNWTDLGAVVGWLCEFQEPSDHVGVLSKGEALAIVHRFIDHGYLPDVNCDADFRPDDRENVARWLIGQALDGLQVVGAIHGIVHKFAAQWRVKFGEYARS